MDNLTHTLVGVVLARAIERKIGRRAPELYWTSVIASNLPDTDFIVGLTFGADKLSYLLHHRGHTHTLLGALPIAGAAAVAAAVITHGTRSAHFWKRFWPCLWTGLAAAVLHIAFDFLNNYGVHPFAPFSGKWFYGDTLFIVEPSLLLSFLCFAAFTAERRWARGTWLALGAGILGLAWFGKYTGALVASGLTLWAYANVWAQVKFPKKALEIALSGAGAIIVAFALSGLIVRHLTSRELANGAPEESVMSLVSSPSPGNPFCWNIITASSKPDGAYVARVASASLLPSILPPETCAISRPNEHTAPLAAPNLPQKTWLRWHGDFHASLKDLRSLRAANCRLAAALRFIRVPFWLWQGGDIVAGDLRYDRPRGRFAEIQFKPGDVCPALVPDWEPPLPLGG